MCIAEEFIGYWGIPIYLIFLIIFLVMHTYNENQIIPSGLDLLISFDQIL